MSKLHIEITYPMQPPEFPSIRTDVKPELVADLLGTWIHGTQTGQGKDETEAVDREEYHISITLDVADDSFITKSDTGNAGLTCGIVLDVMNKIKREKVTWL